MSDQQFWLFSQMVEHVEVLWPDLEAPVAIYFIFYFNPSFQSFPTCHIRDACVAKHSGIRLYTEYQPLLPKFYIQWGERVSNFNMVLIYFIQNCLIIHYILRREHVVLD